MAGNNTSGQDSRLPGAREQFPNQDTPTTSKSDLSSASYKRKKQRRSGALSQGEQFCLCGWLENSDVYIFWCISSTTFARWGIAITIITVINYYITFITDVIVYV